jgi:hypothetical protein
MKKSYIFFHLVILVPFGNSLFGQVYEGLFIRDREYNACLEKNAGDHCSFKLQIFGPSRLGTCTALHGTYRTIITHEEIKNPIICIPH